MAETASDISVRSFPTNIIGMLTGALVAGIGLFLIGRSIATDVSRLVGFFLFLIGVIIFTL